MLFYERAESLEPVASTASSGPLSKPSLTSDQLAVKPESEPAHERQPAAAVAEPQQAPLEAGAEELMPPASPLSMLASSATGATSPCVSAQLANVSPLKV